MHFITSIRSKFDFIVNFFEIPLFYLLVDGIKGELNENR